MSNLKINAILVGLLTATMTLYSGDLLSAIAWVESRNNDYAIGDNGEAVGRYQLHRIYVDDVNRIAGTSYTYADRTDPLKSRQMVEIYLNYYGEVYRQRTGKRPTAEVLARIHNGGPRGYEKNSTKSYWLKIKKEMDSGRY